MHAMGRSENDAKRYEKHLTQQRGRACFAAQEKFGRVSIKAVGPNASAPTSSTKRYWEAPTSRQILTAALSLSNHRSIYIYQLLRIPSRSTFGSSGCPSTTVVANPNTSEKLESS
mmetsp:Transcript_3155/g.19462  ORF Transcript_3155/g.19462 Transcript_3155/m.19462 type:complete len:115 (+) Transcript_3155:3165-3509(+)